MVSRSVSAFVLPRYASAVVSSQPASVNVRRVCLEASPATAVATVVGARTTENYVAVASSYFTSIRIPAALIAGSSLAAFFSLVDQAGEGSRKTSRADAIALSVFHGLAMIALMLSLNVIIIATATAHLLLLGTTEPMATSGYAFLQRNCEYEFLLTRWSFFMSLFSFLGCVAARALVEFRLLRRKRVRSAIVVSSSIGALIFHLVSFVNRRVTLRGNMGKMTIDLLKLYLEWCFTRQSIMSNCSFVCLFVAVGTTISMAMSPSKSTT